MQEEKRKAPGFTEKGDLTKIGKVSSNVSDFVESTCDIKNAIDYLMETLESMGDRLEMVLDDYDEVGVKEARTAEALLFLLAEQLDKLKEEASSCRSELLEVTDE